jgi:hypothetical protein
MEEVRSNYVERQKVQNKLAETKDTILRLDEKLADTKALEASCQEELQKSLNRQHDLKV